MSFSFRSTSHFVNWTTLTVRRVSKQIVSKKYIQNKDILQNSCCNLFHRVEINDLFVKLFFYSSTFHFVNWTTFTVRRVFKQIVSEKIYSKQRYFTKYLLKSISHNGSF